MDNALALTNGRRHDQEYVRGFWNMLNRHRSLAIGVPLAVIAATVAFVLIATPIYEADGSLRVDEENSTVPVLDALKSLSGGSKLDTEMGVLRSRSLAEQVVDSLGLSLELRSPRRVLRSVIFSSVRVRRDAPEARYTVRCSAVTCVATSDKTGARVASAAPGQALALPGAVVVPTRALAERGPARVRVLRFEKAVKKLRDTYVVERPDREADIIALHYQSPDKELVAAVPNTMMRLFVRGRQTSKSAQALSTADFLRTQIDTLTGQLALAENRLKDFREANQIVSPEAEAKADVTRLVEMQAQRDVVEAERGALAALLDDVERTAAATPANSAGPSPMRRLIAFPTLLKNPAAAELLRSLNEVENERSELLNRRTPADPDVQVLTERVHQLEQQLGSIGSTYLTGLGNQVTSLDRVLGRFSATLERIPATEIGYARLERQAKVLSDIYTLLQTRLKEAQIMAAVADPSVQVIDAAIVPYKPVRPDIPLSLAMALVVGLIFGVGLTYARDHLDTSVRTREDLQIASGDIPVLATIPWMGAIAGRRMTDWRTWRRAAPQAQRDRLIAARDPRSPVSEAYRSLRTNITFSRPEETPRVLVFTSPEPGDGKSTSVVNLAVILARQGVRCLLLDADLRRGVLHEVVDAPGEPGLSEVLVGARTLADVVRHIEVDPSVSFEFVPAGTLPPNPAELLGSARMGALLDTVRAEYDMVLVDAPPLNLVTDAAVIGPRSDGVIVVARAGVTDRGALQYAMEQLRAVRAPVLGSILNGIDQRRGRYYGVYGSGAYTARGVS